ncbi:MAG: four-carbon acid sugar kinase family protein [Alphaproteobacteria bacterium]|nr:four-carbon acid sugar kinase family protein [Alphaproteobacteria bacterium]
MAPPLLSFYGDDFTGSTDVMEALASHGLRTVLFTRMPDAEEYRQFAGYRAVGLAGTSRSQTPAWMEAHLRPALAWLKGLGAAHCHYKVCSTFDSSPGTGSIGRAIDIGFEVFAQPAVPLVVGAPQLRRYTAFGHLFAGYQGQVHRIDRHPVMSRHPVTPMKESDLRLHLGRQTEQPIHLVGLDALASPAADGHGDGPRGIVLFDVVDAHSQRAVGDHLLRLAQRTGPFVAGSSGVEYALLQAWIAVGTAQKDAPFPRLGKVDRMLAVSGSCSPTTERQIRHALSCGFDGIAIDPVSLVASDADVRIAALVDDGAARLDAGRSVIVYSALGGGTDRGPELDADPDARNRLGRALGRIMRALIERCRLRRVILAGGDTSSHALSELGILALTTRFPLRATPGSPLCTAHGGPEAMHGLEIAMKGGQVGNDDYFVALRDGT